MGLAEFINEVLVRKCWQPSASQCNQNNSKPNLLMLASYVDLTFNACHPMLMECDLTHLKHNRIMLYLFYVP